MASSFGNGGLAHVFAAAVGLSAVLATSAAAFAAVKYAGAAYLVYLGVRILLERDPGDRADPPEAGETGGRGHAFRQGIVSEALNPKAALFFLSFLPQFVDPRDPFVFQVLLLGCISVALNTSVDLVVAFFAGPIGRRLRERARLRRGQRLATGCALIGLGTYVAVAGERRP